MGNIKDKLDQILASQEDIKSLLETHYEQLIRDPVNKEIRDQIASFINEIKEEKENIVNEMMDFLAEAFNMFSENLDEKILKLYNDLKRSDNMEMKLKIGIPLINLLGKDLETKFDVKKWASTMYEKYEFNIFRIIGFIR